MFVEQLLALYNEVQAFSSRLEEDRARRGSSAKIENGAKMARKWRESDLTAWPKSKKKKRKLRKEFIKFIGLDYSLIIGLKGRRKEKVKKLINYIY